MWTPSTLLTKTIERKERVQLAQVNLGILSLSYVSEANGESVGGAHPRGNELGWSVATHPFGRAQRSLRMSGAKD